ncbi:MAG: ATP-binding cassette domain-containing protein, partial [Bacteroidaceae bacterium]|nr:ATP-binding cassette domain-containing protein [Bacteroidaceae bacterium]
SMKPDSGAVLINGEPLEWHKDLIGFVPQDDLLIEELTVWENLMFTARFCFGDETDEQLSERVTACLTDLDLLEFADLKVGSPLNKTISGGQRKRLNIALELIRQPAILFLDEPTSGLSSADSEKVILLLKQQTYAGRLVLTNIHQPSSDIYKLFDHLWMLDRGGYPIYNGNPIEAITYFKTAAHKPDAESAVCQSCGTVNPEVMMEIIDAKALDANGRVTNARKVSPQEWHEAYLEMEKSEGTAAEEAATQQTDAGKPDKKPATASPLRQFGIYLYRTVKCKLANRQFVFIALLEAPLLAAVVAFLTRYSGENGYSLMHNHNLTSYYFMAIIVATFMGMSLTAEEIFRDKALLKREKFLHLSFRSYISSKITFTACITA